MSELNARIFAQPGSTAVHPLSCGNRQQWVESECGAVALGQACVQDIGGDVYVTYAPAGLQNMTQAPLGGGGRGDFR